MRGTALACSTPNNLLAGNLDQTPNWFGKDTKVMYQTGGELYLIPDRTLIAYTAFLKNVVNLDFCSKIRLVDVHDGAIGGLGFWRKDSDNFYVFFVTSNGSLGVSQKENGQWKQPAASYKAPDASRSSGKMELEVKTIGSRATFLVDDVELGTITDDQVPSAAHDFGYITGADKTRPIFAFSEPSAAVLQGASSDGQDKASFNAETAGSSSDTRSGPDRRIGEDAKTLFELVEAYNDSDANDYYPEEFKLQSVEQPPQIGDGAADIVFHYVGKDETNEFVLRFFQSKELAESYWADGNSSPLFKDASELGPVLASGEVKQKGLKMTIPYLAGTSADKASEWVTGVKTRGVPLTIPSFPKASRNSKPALSFLNDWKPANSG